MPTYVYRCEKCKSVFDFFEESPKNKKDDSEMFCPECGLLLKRIYNVPSVVYKGKGFYTTDNQKEE